MKKAIISTFIFFCNLGCSQEYINDSDLETFITKFDQAVMKFNSKNELIESYSSFIDSMKANPFSLILSEPMENLINDFVTKDVDQKYFIKNKNVYFYNLDEGAFFKELLNRLSRSNSFFSEYGEIIGLTYDIPPSLHDKFISELSHMDFSNKNVKTVFVLHMSIMYLTH